MRRQLTLFGLTIGLLAMASTTFAAEQIRELWRSRMAYISSYPWDGAYGGPRLVVNPTDSTIWLIEGGTVTHLSPTGDLLARSPALPVPHGLAFDPGNGTCWVFAGEGALVHLSPTAEVLSITGRYSLDSVLTPSPADGSLWITGTTYWTEFPPTIVHVNAAGQEVARLDGYSFPVVVDPGDGTAWYQDGNAVVCLNADGSQRWRSADLRAGEVAYQPGLSACASPADYSVWIGTDAGRLVHLDAADGHLLFDTTDPQPIAAINCNPLNGSAWVDHYQISLPDITYWEYVDHRSADGTLLWHVDGWVWAMSASAGAVAVHSNVGNGNTSVYADNHQLLATYSFWTDWYLWAFDPVDNSVWSVPWAPDPLYTKGYQVLRHRAANGGLLCDLPVRHLHSAQLDPADGSIWAPDNVDPLQVLHFSPEGADLGSLPLPADHPDAVLDPTDHSWWEWGRDYVAQTLTLLHFATDGTELSNVTMAGVHDVVSGHLRSPADGSVWVASHLYADLESGEMPPPNGTIYRYAADGSLLASQELAYWVDLVEVRPDGSLWYLRKDLTSYALVHLSASFAVLEEIPFSTDATDVKYVRLDIAHGAIYLMTRAWIEGVLPEDPWDDRVVRLSGTGELLWQSERLFDADLTLAPDGTLWVTDAGYYTTGPSVPGFYTGCSLSHRNANGQELSRYTLFNSVGLPFSNPRDGSVWVTDGAGQLVHLTAYGSFADVSNGFWAYDEIEACYAAGLVAGYADGSYHPEFAVTRGQMAAFIARAMCGGEASVPTGPAEASFADVPVDAPFFRHIEYAHAQGVVTGYQDGTYHPEWGVNRGQMAAFLARAQCGGDDFVPSGPATASFTDVPLDFGFYRYIEYLHTAGLTTGYSDGTYHPEWVCNRDQMAVFVARAFHLLP